MPATLHVSARGTMFLEPADLVSPQWLGARGWKPSGIKAGAWFQPATVARWQEISELLGDDLHLSKPLCDWLDHLGVARITMKLRPVDLSRADADLYEHQRRAVAWLAARDRALLGVAPGLGKTAIAVQAAELQPPGAVMVIVPKTIIANWAREIRRWAPGAEIVTWRGDDVRRYPGSGRRYTVVNYDTVVKQMRFPDKLARLVKAKPYTTLIVDESAMIKNRKSARRVAIAELRKSFPTIWMLSGAPAPRYYDDLFSQLQVLDRKHFTSYWRFVGEYCQVEATHWGTSILGNLPDADERARQRLSPWYMSMGYADTDLDIPEWVFHEVDVPLTGPQWSAYRQMQDTFVVDLLDGPPNELIASNKLTQLLRLNQLASNPALIGGADQAAKWEALDETLEMYPGPYLVWTAFIETARKIADRLARSGLRVTVLAGETKDADRQATVDAFQAGELDALVAHPGVGKYGLTLTRARTAVYVERTYNGDDYFQSLYRLRRIGTKLPPNVVHLTATGPEGERTVDHVIKMVLDYRTQSSHRLTRELVSAALSGGDIDGPVDPPLARPDRLDGVAVAPSPRSPGVDIPVGRVDHPVRPPVRPDQADWVDFTRPDRRVRREASAPAPVPRPAGSLPPVGFYTILLGDESDLESDYLTVRVSDWPSDDGRVRRALRYLRGAENVDDRNYTGFAHWEEGDRPRLWKRFTDQPEGGRLRRALERMAETSDWGAAGLRYALRSNHCYRCGRLLTVPTSIHSGLGPDCAARES